MAALTFPDSPVDTDTYTAENGVNYYYDVDHWIVLASPLAAAQAQDAFLDDIAALTDPGADRVLVWDDSAGKLDWSTPTLGLEQSTTNIQMTANQRTHGIKATIGNGADALTTGVKGYIEVPYACTIQQVTTLADVSGSLVVDIWKDTYANFPPLVADTITASALPTLVTTTKDQDATLTGWTTSIAAGDILAFNINSVTTIKKFTITLEVLKT